MSGAPASHKPRGAMAGLLIAQFFGAFNDNAWKQLVILLTIGAATAGMQAGSREYEQATQSQTSLIQTLFLLPLVLLSIPAGGLADRFSKQRLIVALKLVELVLLIAGTCFLWIYPQGGLPVTAILFLMGAHSALFSPAKYGILPELVEHERLSASNGQLEMWTNLAIILGTVAGGFLLQETQPTKSLLGWAEGHTWIAGATLSLLSLVGFVASWSIPHVPPARAGASTWNSLAMGWRALRSDRILWLAFLGQVVVWLVATLIPIAVLTHVKSLEVSDAMASFPLAVLAIGIGIGSILAGRLSASKIEYGLVPLGAMGLTVCALIFAVSNPTFGQTLVLMIGLGIAGGLILIPLNSLIQWRSPADVRGAVIATMNVLVFGAMMLGSAFGYVLATLHISPLATFGVAGLMMGVSTIWALKIVPDAALRLVLVLLANTFYRLRILGREHVPAEGPALLVANHVSFADGLFLIGATDRPLRFVVWAEFFERPILGRLLRAMRAIPIASSGGPRMILRAFRDAGRYLDEGHLVCIFPEGQITRTGTLLPFQRGVQNIVKGRTVPIIPVYLDRATGSIFSRSQRRRIPQQLPYPITVAFGQPLPADAPLARVRQAITDLGCDAWMERRNRFTPLHRVILRRARRHPFRASLVDAMGKARSRLSVAADSLVLAYRLRRIWKDQPRVATFLPTDCMGGMLQLATSLAGRSIVPLPQSALPKSLATLHERLQFTTLISSRQFEASLANHVPSGLSIIWLEDVCRSSSHVGRGIARLLVLFAPFRVIEWIASASRSDLPDDEATILAQADAPSGVRGVVLTRFNVASHVDQLAQVYRIERTDRILLTLPQDHPVGHALFWFCVAQGLEAVFAPQPLDAATVGSLVERHHITILFASPTWLRQFSDRCTPAQFGTLRLVLTGTEPLPEGLSREFEETFGVRPLEGYGATECTAVIAASTLDERGAGFFQPGSRKGYVGQSLPGIALHVAQPITQPGDSQAAGEPAPASLTPGQLLVRGPNVMRGYLNQDDLTHQVMRDGWYVTGDLAIVDEDGFVKIIERHAPRT